MPRRPVAPRRPTFPVRPVGPATPCGPRGPRAVRGVGGLPTVGGGGQLATWASTPPVNAGGLHDPEEPDAAFTTAGTATADTHTTDSSNLCDHGPNISRDLPFLVRGPAQPVL